MRFPVPSVVRPVTTAWAPTTFRGAHPDVRPDVRRTARSRRSGRSLRPPRRRRWDGWTSFALSFSSAASRSAIIARNSASATTCPSTWAAPALFQTAPFCFTISTCSSSRSPGTTRPAEPRAVDRHEVGDLARRLLSAGMDLHGEERGGLGERLEDEHARHHRLAREVPEEERLVHGDALPAHEPLARLEEDHAVDEQERRPVRDEPLDLPRRRARSRPSRSRSWQTLLLGSQPRDLGLQLADVLMRSARRWNAAVLRSHSACGRAGIPP